MQQITRTIVTTTIKAKQLVHDKAADKITDAVLEPLVLENQDISEDEAMKRLRKKYGQHAMLIITSIDKSEKIYAMSVADFIKNAKVLPPRPPKDKPIISDVVASGQEVGIKLPTAPEAPKIGVIAQAPAGLGVKK